MAQSRRATVRLAAVREERAALVDVAGTVVVAEDTGGPRWWTWTGGRANAVLAAALDAVAPGLIEPVDRYDNRYLRLGEASGAGDLRAGLAAARARFGNDLVGVEPQVSEEAVRALKFAELLPPALAHATLAARLGDHAGTERPLAGPLVAAAGQ